MKIHSWLPFAILLSGLALYFSPTLNWFSPQFRSEVTVATTTRVKKLLATSTPVQKPASVVAAKPAPAKSGPVEETRPAPKAPAASTSPATPTPTSSISETEQYIFDLTNAERAQEGLAALAWDARLATIARGHSSDMLAKNYFSHEDPSGCSSSCRANNANYAWMAIGENIYMTEGYKLSSTAEAEMIVNGWMNSSGHRANILGTKFTHTGVGISVKGDSVYVTAMYSKPR